MSVLRYALLCSTGATVASLAAITVAARMERKSPWRPINATSHWLWGEEAGGRHEVDMRHTLVGGLTNLIAATFWGGLFGAHLSRKPELSKVAIVRDAGVMSAIAGLLDYGLLPRRLRPGWELALSSRSVILSMAIMALGLATGGLGAKAMAEGLNGDANR